VAVKPTRLPVLLMLFVLSGAVAYLLSAAYYADLPSPSSYAPVSLVLLAAAEGYTAAATAARLAGRPRTRPIDPLTVARLAALAKATSPVAAVLTGGYAGFLAYVAHIEGSHASDDVRTASIGVAAGLLLVIAALALERVCRVRRPRDDEPGDGN
jgi:hypothetical protein